MTDGAESDDRRPSASVAVRVRPSADAKRGSCRVCFALYKPETEAAVCPLSKGRNRRSVVGVATAGQVYSGFNFSSEGCIYKEGGVLRWLDISARKCDKCGQPHFMEKGQETIVLGRARLIHDSLLPFNL